MDDDTSRSMSQAWTGRARGIRERAATETLDQRNGHVRALPAQVRLVRLAHTAAELASASPRGLICHRLCRCADPPCRRATSAIIAMLRCRAPYGLSARRDGAATAARRRSRSPCDPWSAFASMRTRTGHAHGRLEDPHHRLRRRVGLLGPLRCEGVSIGRRLRQAHLERAALGADRPFRPASRIGPARRAGRDRGRTRRRSRSARIG